MQAEHRAALVPPTGSLAFVSMSCIRRPLIPEVVCVDFERRAHRRG